MEVCVDSFESVINAFEGGADRIELCSSLNEGGLTPTYGLFKAAKGYLHQVDKEGEFKIYSMIRCRPGDFNYNDMEMETMEEDLKKLIELGTDGIVFGALDPYGNVDEVISKQFLHQIPNGIGKTFHRAFDVCSNWKKSFENIESLGFDKLLTSGLSNNAYDGRWIIKELVDISKKLAIVAGAGINCTNLESILKDTSVKEFHSSCRSLRNSTMIHRNHQINMGSQAYDEFSISLADKQKVKELKEIFNKFF